RANLVQCIGGGGGVTLTANYSGHFAGPSTFSGFYYPSQILRKVVFTSLPANTNQTTNGIAIPYGVISGNLIIKASGASFPAGSTIQIRSHVGENSLLYPTLNLQNSTNTQSLMLPVTPGTSFDVIYTSGGASAATFSAYFIDYSPALLPASAQPPTVSNSEVTQLSGAASVTLGAGAGQ